MPTDSDSHHDADRDRERERDRDLDRGDRADRGGSKQKSSSASKTKDLSHVPCKFFKVGGCTAGASCPFSHSSAEPGGQKETCTWFVKGNCKFGHKCALAHVLPGQSMAMDRKNKKAAQTAAQAVAGANSGDKNSKQSGRSSKRESASGSGNAANRLPLLAGGATAPTRNSTSGSSSSGRPPMNMPLKATISPSAPAPPLQDTDFASFANLEEMESAHKQKPTSKEQPEDEVKHPSSYAEAASASYHSTTTTSTNANNATANAVPVSVPTSAPRSSTNTAAADFGPIGSPPNYRAGQPTSPSAAANGGTFSTGTSPRAQSHINGVNINSPSSTADNNAGMLSTSPFSAPGTQSGFLSSSFTTGGVAASLGSGLAMMGGRRGWGDSDNGMGPNSFSGLLSSQLSSSVSQQRSLGLNSLREEHDINFEEDDSLGLLNGRRMARGAEVAVEEEDLEDFLPSSLNDLLTPEERSRRMSRSNSGQAPGSSHLTKALATAAGAENTTFASGNGNSGLGHRYSRSVPAPSLLGDIKSIWADNSANPLPSSPPTHRGTPSASYTSRFDPYGTSTQGDEGLSMSMGSAGTPSSLGMMSPSNASAAFLPGLHHHYLNSKAKQTQSQQHLGLGGIARQLQRTSNPVPTSNNSLASNYLQPLGGLGLPSSASTSSGLHTHTHGNTQTTYRTTPSPFDLTQTLHQQPQTSRPISNLSSQKLGAEDPLLGPHLLSPSTRALQQHAPGQSLPQGLAAGYSRIHALPPLTNIASPPTSGSFIPGTSPSANNAYHNNEGIYGDWAGLHNPAPGSVGGVSNSNSNHSTGLESMFSRLGYSGANSGSRSSQNVGPPPGLSRNVSGGRYPSQSGVVGNPLSPLSGPVVRRDDDDLFDMDK
ncbi:hypothetical protein CPC08DRAFT_315734 [Agrocybe pediades]|nr:hypothetical protein CPC08DRAFT_315734 [Agrocybe pediades]